MFNYMHALKFDEDIRVLAAARYSAAQSLCLS